MTVDHRITRRIADIFATPKPDPRAWAHELKAREEAGAHLTAVQRLAWREALYERPVATTREPGADFEEDIAV